MAQSGYTPISLYYSATGAAVPLAADLIAGELALNTNDGKLYYKNSSNVVTLLAGATAGPAGGSTTQVQYNNGGVLAGITGATTNGTALTLVAPVLGTPASGTVTNLTGTASININGTVGATTATTGAFTSGTFSAASRFDSNLAVGGTPVQATRLSVKQSGTTLLTGMSVEASATDSLLALYSDGTDFNIRSDYNTTGIYQPIKLWTSGAVAMTIGAGGASAPVTIPGTLAVTGTLSTTNDITYTLSQNATDSIKVVNANAGASALAEMRVTNNTTALFMAASGTGYSGALVTSGVAGYHALSTFGAVGLSIGTNITAAININSSQAVSMTNGLAVTGTLSATTTVAGSGGASTLSVPTRQVFLTGTAATYTTPANCRRIVVRIKGGGGGTHGSSNDSSGGNGGTGGTTTFNSINANGGGAGPFGQGGQVANSQGGTSGTGTASLRIAGACGQGPRVTFAAGTTGFVGGGGGGTGGAYAVDSPGYATMAGQTGQPNSGGGGSGAGLVPVTSANAYGLWPSSGGGEGEYAEIAISSPAGTYTYTVGAGGAAGTTGTGGYVGGAGGSGFIYVDEYY